MTPSDIAGRVSPDRLDKHLSALAAIGGTPNGGVNRQAFTTGDQVGRGYLNDLAQALNLEISMDAIGNQFFRMAGTTGLDGPAISTGSHLDTQPTGGRLDGVLGIVAGFEAVAAMRESGFVPLYPVEIVNWTNEEGCRFAPGCMGSMVHCGVKQLEDFLPVTDSDGVTFAEALRETFATSEFSPARETGRPIRAYIELHIEQGPLLERAGIPVGLVRSIQGCRWFEVEVTGETRHAGTTPLLLRRDALRGAITGIHAINETLHDPEDILRLTVGRLLVEPGAPNVVPNHVVYTIDLRHPEEVILDRTEIQLRKLIVVNSEGCDTEIRRMVAYPPTPFDPVVLSVIESAAADLGIQAMLIDSGAFHDALHLARFGPSGMIFVPSVAGISHHPAEATAHADLVAGARVLTAALVQLARA